MTLQTPTPLPSDLAPRHPGARPPGGLTWAYLRIELLRTLRNPWTVGFSTVMPAALYLLFGAAPAYGREQLDHGNVAGSIMATMALFGAMTAAISVASTVSDERGSGWTRQLRLTPLRPLTYVGSKLIVALVVGLLVVAVTYVVGFATGARLDPSAAVTTFAIAWLVGTALFAALGIALGYIFRSDAVMGVAGPLLSLFGFFGGLFVPLEQLGSVMERIGSVTPMFGARVLVHDAVRGAGLDSGALLNVAFWFVAFVAVAVWRFRRVGERE